MTTEQIKMRLTSGNKGNGVMQVQIGYTGKRWQAVCGSQVVAWGEFYSDVFTICKERGWVIEPLRIAR